MSWKQTVAGALVIALVAAAVVWFLEDFERARVREMMREEWTAWLEKFPVRGEGAAGDG